MYPARRPCQVCGAGFSVTRRHNAAKVKYCSPTCAGRGQRGLGPRDLEADMQTVFDRYVVRRGPEECWDWSAFKYKGYGRMNIAGPGEPRRIVGAHRVSFILHHGPIGEGMTVLHKCDTPSCTNPKHLFLGTNEDNNRDRDSKSRQAFGERNHAKLTEADVILVRRSLERTDEEWADLLGVSRPTIQCARNGRTWKHLNAEHPPRAGMSRWRAK